jgi:hypothetical protein
MKIQYTGHIASLQADSSLVGPAELSGRHAGVNQQNRRLNSSYVDMHHRDERTL